MDCLYQDNRIVHDRTVDGHVKKLRIKLRVLLGEHDVIQSVYGAGYRYHPEILKGLHEASRLHISAGPGASAPN